MDTFKRIGRWWAQFQTRLRRPVFEPDSHVDTWIQAALWEDTSSVPSATAWERLCKAVVDRRVLRRPVGMWVLNEPLRDPPESPPMLLAGRDLARAQRLHAERRDLFRRGVPVDVWNNLAPSFTAFVNW